MVTVEGDVVAAIKHNIINRNANKVIDELSKWKGLHESGAITEQEYNAKKEQLLNL